MFLSFSSFFLRQKFGKSALQMHELHIRGQVTALLLDQVGLRRRGNNNQMLGIPHHHHHHHRRASTPPNLVQFD